MIYRIKQISENKFIPQCGTIGDFIFGSMEGIEKGSTYTWMSKDVQKTRCIVSSLEEAREVIKQYKEDIIEYPKGYPKYHKA